MISDLEAIMMDEKDIKKEETEKQPLSETWPEDSVQDILDYIEEQGIYIRE